jgi:hypothetical protein
MKHVSRLRLTAVLLYYRIDSSKLSRILVGYPAGVLEFFFATCSKFWRGRLLAGELCGPNGWGYCVLIAGESSLAGSPRFEPYPPSQRLTLRAGPAARCRRHQTRF